MAYETEELIKEAIDAAKKYKLVMLIEIISFMSCTKSTFYEKGINENEELKEVILKNKIEIKAGLRKKWFDGDNATSQIALYKLLATEEEHDKLTMSNIKHSGDETSPINIVSLGSGIKPEDE